MPFFEQGLFTLSLIAALGSGLIAGVFFVFSSFVMKALARLPTDQGIAAMQSINVVVLNRWFLGVFLGTAVLSALAVAAAILMWPRSDATIILASGVLYLAGFFFVTIAFNVPRNDALAMLAAENSDSAEAWARTLMIGHGGITCARWARWLRRYFSALHLRSDEQGFSVEFLPLTIMENRYWSLSGCRSLARRGAANGKSTDDGRPSFPAKNPVICA